MAKSINKKLIIPTLIAIASYLLAYQIPKIIIEPNRLHYINTDLDSHIILHSPAIIIYLLSYFQWIGAIIILIKQETKKGYKLACSIIIGSIIGFIIFMVYPTAIIRPEVISNNFFDDLVKLVYSVDSVVNAFPSFHCFCSTMSVLILIESDDVKKSTIIINIIFSILVFISTILTKQHVLIDIPGGILLAFVSYYLSYLIFSF